MQGNSLIYSFLYIHGLYIVHIPWLVVLVSVFHRSDGHNKTPIKTGQEAEEEVRTVGSLEIDVEFGWSSMLWKIGL